jgi:DNA-binding beta-propeller fold protein YncE
MRLKLAPTGFVLALGLACAAGAQTPSYHAAGRIPLTDGGWDYVSVDPATNRLYVARTDAVTAVDLGSNEITAKLAAAQRGHQVLPLPGGAELLVTNGTPGTAEFIDAKTGKSLASVKVGKGPDAAIYDAKSGLAIVINHAGGTVALVDPRKHVAVAEIPVGGAALEYAAIDPAGHLFVNDEDTAEMVEIDLARRKVMTHIRMTGCEGPTGLAYLPESKRMLAACGNGVAALVNPKTAKFDRTLPIGKGADAVIHDARRKLVFVPAGQSGDLTVFADEAKGVRELGKVATQIGARTGAVDEKTGKIYLPAADYTPPATAGGRSQAKPGSVVLLEIDP